MTMIEIMTLCGTLLNTGILTSIWYKIGVSEEKHKSHESRLTKLEGKLL